MNGGQESGQESGQETGGRLTLGLAVLMLMAMALVASELRSGGEDGADLPSGPDHILFLEAGKG
ncbi:hypothetical protein [Lentisalinibacter orientalis]|uniref:hypothetical protein n=1 Tax=Lentisalinibacter orientalis TaxID=2992241 RepID=UPI003866BE7B